MKKLLVVLAAIVAASWLNESHAEKQRLPISFSGTIVTNGVKLKATQLDLLSSSSNRLVIVVDLAAQTVEIEEWTSNLTEKVDRQADLSGTNAIFGSIRMGFFTNATGTRAQMQSDLEQEDLDWDDDDEPDSDGDLQLAARLSMLTGTITKVTGKLQGVVNDQVNGATNTVNTLLTKGKIKSTGPAF